MHIPTHRVSKPFHWFSLHPKSPRGTVRHSPLKPIESLALAAIIFLSGTTYAMLPEVPELKWGFTLSDFRQLSFDIEEEWTVWNRATAVRLGAQAGTNTKEGSFILVFDEEFGLVKTHWASPPIERDHNGTKGIQSFERMKASIIAKYGQPQETHEDPAVQLNGYHGNFYQCLQDESCGKWNAIWETPEEGLLILELVGLDEGIGFVQMTHQGPNLMKVIQDAHKNLYSKEQQI